MRRTVVFHKLHEIGNNANIGIKDFTLWKQKMLPQWVLNPLNSDSKSKTALSELIWHVLLRRYLNLGFDTHWGNILLLNFFIFM